MTEPYEDSTTARRFAVDVVRRLQAAGFIAYWAGGCVRDQLLGCLPKDYDVATEATPEQISQVFGRRRTLALGASFGVMTVVGRGDQGNIEVATFRSDSTYSDGRHPDKVQFAGPELDAQRRDFTINGLFFDPLHDQIIDYVGGRADLRRGIVRAIGDPDERIGEDKLRMLRGIRFSTTLDFAIDPATLAAIKRHAADIGLVSAERITAELRRMLEHPRRGEAVQLLVQTTLLQYVLPSTESGIDAQLAESIDLIGRLRADDFPAAVAALLWPLVRGGPRAERRGGAICRQWKLSNEDRQAVEFILSHLATVRDARPATWPRVQRVLISPSASRLLAVADAVAAADRSWRDGLVFCQRQLALPAEQFNPPPLLTGDDLVAAGFPPGPAFGRALAAVRDAQLQGQIETPLAALEMARRQLADEE